MKDKIDFVILKTKIKEAEASGNEAESLLYKGMNRILDLAFPRLREDCEEAYSE